MLESLRLQNFTAFEHVELNFAPGINVIIGENATGKTHLLKVLYAVASVVKPESEVDRPSGGEAPLADRVDAKLVAVFRPTEPGGLRGLIRRVPGTGAAEAFLSFGDEAIGIQFGFNGVTRTQLTRNLPATNTVYIGSREVLTLLPWFPPLYEKFDLPFDETHFDLCRSLLLPPLRERGRALMTAILPPLERLLGGSVQGDRNGLYLERPSGDRLEATLLAEGHRKLAQLVRLVDNGSVEPGTLLLWDEPEAGVNPGQMPAVAAAVAALARGGVQVVLTTHDHVLPQELSLLAEFPGADGEPPIGVRFFGLTRESLEDPVRVDAGDTLADLPENPTLNALLAHQDHVQRLQDAELQVDAR